MNPFVNMMKMFPEADTLMIEKFVDEDTEAVVASPMRFSDGYVWVGMMMVSGLKEAVESGYGIATPEGNETLVARISALKGKQPTIQTR